MGPRHAAWFLLAGFLAATAGRAETAAVDFPAEPAAARRQVAGSPYAADSAGMRLEFVTDATRLVLTVSYADQADMADHRYFLSEGEWIVDGEPRLSFTRASGGGGAQDVELALDGPPRVRKHEIYLPLADRVEFRGLAVNEGARVRRQPPVEGRRVVAYGDSITQGFYATRPSRSYPAQLARATGWNVMNMGFCGRITTPEDAAAIASLKPDAVLVLIGENDVLLGTDLAVFAERYQAFLEELIRRCPGLPIVAATPPEARGRKWNTGLIEDYRQAIRVAAAERPAVHLVEGPELLAGSRKLLADGLHPNDAGFETLARSFENALRPAFDAHP
ncbi:MAG TPA: SGNH/GDSL hydrolase family protein [Kiritimatiellia bacterium]|nr:SGNH/GDSL hydrolase family protein [Kiritimatiellia bacterium]HRZ12175.1 SGNH/GDSL hydrolase family protein [Kiritimatiellia bacterium]HSA18067.1 SGNH/GDSL hydrolase family protein [Kiritimatiellia bacterium]